MSLKFNQHDFAEEASKLFKKLNLPDPSEKQTDDENAASKPDVVWIHPTTGAKFFIGDLGAAKSLEILEKENIFHIINA